MSNKSLPWSYYAVIVTFAIFFFSLNAYLLTAWLSHPLQSDFWLLGVGIGLAGLLYSIYMVRIHQKELIAAKEEDKE
ncbi:MAG: hypothetical protein ACXADC_13430 [Candidatus Thorarchaeota archaeon]|jgi:hypothetical protein